VDPHVVANGPRPVLTAQVLELGRGGLVLHEKLQAPPAAVAVRVGLDDARALHVRLTREDEHLDGFRCIVGPNAEYSDQQCRASEQLFHAPSPLGAQV